MSVLKEVAISGSVGKQVFADSDEPVILENVIATAGGASAVVVTVRDGNASGDVKLIAKSQAAVARPFRLGNGVRFDKGMHVKVIGTGGLAYLVIR